MIKNLLLLLALITCCVAQDSQIQTPEFASALLMNRIRSGCATSMSKTDATFQVPAKGQLEWTYVLNGKQFSQREWIDVARRTQVSQCTTDKIEVEFPGTFPSTAIVLYRLQHAESIGHRTRIFSVYAKHTYEYVNSEWVLRKMEAINAK